MDDAFFQNGNRFLDQYRSIQLLGLRITLPLTPDLLDVIAIIQRPLESDGQGVVGTAQQRTDALGSDSHAALEFIRSNQAVTAMNPNDRAWMRWPDGQ